MAELTGTDIREQVRERYAGHAKHAIDVSPGAARRAEEVCCGTTGQAGHWGDVLYNAESVEYLIKMIGVDNVLFGTDRPANGDTIDPQTGHAFNDIKWYIDSIPWLTDEDRYKLYEGNVRRLFPRARLR